MISGQTHSIAKDGRKYTWRVETLWKEAQDLEPFEYKIESCAMLDEDCWFGDRHEPTVRRVMEHSRKIANVDLTYPIILSEDDVVMDGLHRICSALLDGKTTILAVKFASNPKPDMIEPLS